MSDSSSQASVQPDTKVYTCALCETAVAPGGFVMLNDHITCHACADQVQAEIADSQAGAGSIPMAVAGGAIGAAVGAAVWAGIGIGTEYEIGYVAVLVGFLAGVGVKTLTGGSHGTPLQLAAVLCAVGGLLAAKYAIFAHEFTTVVREGFGMDLGYLAPETRDAFVEYSGDLFGGFDLLWLALAVGAAWRVPATPRVDSRSA